MNVIWRHVKGHAGDPGNEAADILSKMATDRQKEATTRNVKETAGKTSTSRNTSAEKGGTSLTNKNQKEEQRGRTESEPQDVLTEANYAEIPKKSAKKRNGSSASAFTQTYPSKLEIHQEELLKVFKSMETQVLKIVEQSYADQIDNDKTCLEKENIWLKDKIKDLEELLKTEKKEKERLQREVKQQVRNDGCDDRRLKELEECDRKRRASEVEVHSLKREREMNLSEIKLQQEKCASIRKMLESVRKDLQYTSERLEMSQKESVKLQEKIAQLQEKEEKQHDEIKELKRQIRIRDDIIQKEDEDMGLPEVSRKNSRKNINLNASSPSQKTTESNHSESQVFAESNDIGQNQQSKESQEVITVDDEDRSEICQNKIEENACTHEEDNTQVRMNADVLLIGTSIIKDIDTQRMSNETIVKKHVLKQKTIEGALKFISNLEGNIKMFLLQIGSNDLEQDSTTNVYHGIEKVIKLITSKFPGSNVLVSGLLPRWKINPREGMVFKNKKSEVNDKLSRLPGITFCAQDNFNRHMFYDGTHLNHQGTAQLASNYKYWMGKAMRPTKMNGGSTHWRHQESGNSELYPHNRTNFKRVERQRDSYANRVRGQQLNFPRSTPDEKQMGSGSDNKLFSLVKLLKEILNSN